MAKIDREVVGGEQVVRVTFRHFSFVCLFLMLWLSMWSFACYNLAADLIAKPFAIKELLFALPFFAGEIVVLTILLMMLFGHTTITFTRSGGTSFTGIGKIGYRKAFTFPTKCEICTDEIVVHGRRGASVSHRLVVKTPYDLDGPRVIYTSGDADLIYTLCKVAKEVADVAAAPAKPKCEDDVAMEESELERSDRNLLAGRPPKGIAVTRDFEGRVFVTLRRVGWVRAAIITAVISGFAAFLWTKRGDIPVPAIAFLGFCFLFPLAQIVYALFGKCTITLDHGTGVTFNGVGGIGARRRFAYGGPFDVRLSESSWRVNGERMNEIHIFKPGGQPTKICTTWPNDVKPYLAALLRHPESAAATMPM